MPGPAIREAARADVAAMLGIYAPIVAETAISFEDRVPGDAEFADRVRRYRATHAWLVSEDAHGVAGYAYGSPHRTRGAYRWCTEVTVYVAERARGRGVGRALYGALLPVLAGRGYVMAYAGIALPNPASVALHEACGFTPVGVFRNAGYKLGAWHDIGWWQRPLADPPPVPGEVPPTG